MGMMDDLSKRVEKFGKDVERSVTGKKKPRGGHTLGGAADSALDQAFDAARPLGMTLTKADDGRAAVTGVAQQGQAESKAVRVGDVIAALNGAAVDYDAFVAGVAAARSTGGRVRVRFARPLPRGISTKTKPLSNDQRDARRDAMARAAEKRGLPPPRRKKVAEAPRSPTVFDEGPRSAETQAAWEHAQNKDERTKRDLGYEPFQAVSSGGTLEHEQRALEAPEFAGGGRRLDGRAACPEAEVACEALELCVDKAAALTCAETVLKLLGNASKGDAKFRRVRLGNKAIQERILAVDGGLEIMCTAGFELAEDADDETVLLLKDGFDAARLDAATKTIAAFAAKARLANAK
jgi:hypothetical protein